MNSSVFRKDCNGRIALLLCLAVIAAALCACSESTGPVEGDDRLTAAGAAGDAIGAAGEAKKWTFLFYSGADYPYTGTPLVEFARSFPSSDKVNTICLEDLYEEQARTYYVNEDGGLEVLEELGEINTGSVDVLASFIEYAKTQFPAERYIISFYGHGGGWGGACPDMNPSFDILRMGEINSALTDNGGVDITMFSAPCHMGAFESAYELRGCTDVYVGSENASYFMLWYNAMGEMWREIDSNPDISTYGLARKIPEWMKDDYSFFAKFGGHKNLTMASVRTDMLDDLGEALSAVATAYLDDPAHFRAIVEEARKKITCFRTSSIVDIKVMMDQLIHLEKKRSIVESLEEVLWRLDDAILAEIHHSSFHQVGGLSIYLPDDETGWMTQYYTHPDYGLDFPVDTDWDELMLAAFPPSTAAPEARNILPIFHEPIRSMR